MAILNFPNTRPGGSPLQEGDTYTGDNGVIYTYDGVKWLGRNVAVSANADAIINSGYVVQVDTGGNLVTPSYILPNTVGTTSQVLTWPASGNTLVWTTSSGGGSTGTSWDLTSQGNGCPINVTLTTTTFDVQVPRNHLFFRDDGSWDIGSYFNTNYITGDTLGGNGIALTTDRGTVFFGNSPEICGPTAASHFHIMKQDPTLVDLFFGDDFNNLKLPTTGGVSLQAFNTQTTISSTWIFDGDGVLTLPQGGTISETVDTTVITPPGGSAGQGLVIRPTGGVNPRTITVDHPNGFVPGETITITFSTPSPSSGFTYLQWQILGLTPEQLGTPSDSEYYAPNQSTTGTLVVYDSGTVSLTWTIPENSDMTSFTLTILSTNFGSGGTDGVTVTLDGHAVEEHGHLHLVAGNPTNYDLYLGDDDQYVKIERNAGNVVIGTNTNTNQWTFGTDGNLNIPDDIQDANGSVIRIATTSTAPTRVNGQLWFNTEDGRSYIKYENNWVDLSPPEVPSPSTYLDGLTISDTTISAVDTTATVSIESGANVWEFGTDGTLTFPAGYALPNTVGTAGQVLSVSTNSNVLYWTTASGGTLSSELGLVTFPGDLLIGTLWPDDPMPMGDKESVVWAKDDTEYLGLWWGGSQTYPEEFYGPVAGIMIGTGDGSMTDDFVQGPSPTGTNITLAINDDMGTLEWVFGRDGGLTFPDNTQQTTAYTGTVAYSNITGAPASVNKTSGSWILATGSNTVSITVAPGGNYQMWVNGNIPNGIVEWNATVNVSNPNVPVIGNQNAWYYYAGNALVLTAIPDQIVGTAGVISTATSYVGTTSNVFSFGITNNSISTQTVYWGYTTL